MNYTSGRKSRRAARNLQAHSDIVESLCHHTGIDSSWAPFPLKPSKADSERETQAKSHSSRSYLLSALNVQLSLERPTCWRNAINSQATNLNSHPFQSGKSVGSLKRVFIASYWNLEHQGMDGLGSRQMEVDEVKGNTDSCRRRGLRFKMSPE